MSVEPPSPPKDKPTKVSPLKGEPKTAPDAPQPPAEPSPAAARKVGSRSTEKRPKGAGTQPAASPPDDKKADDEADDTKPTAAAAAPAAEKKTDDSKKSGDDKKPAAPAAPAAEKKPAAPAAPAAEKKPAAPAAPAAEKKPAAPAAPAADKKADDNKKPADDKADDKGEKGKKKRGTTSRPGPKKPAAPPRATATSMGLIIFCLAGIAGAGGGVYLATRDSEPAPLPPSSVAAVPSAPMISLAPKTEAPPPEEAPRPRASKDDPSEEIENLLAAGRERAAMDLLVERRPAPSISARLRTRILEQSKEALEKTAVTLRALVAKGQDPEQRLTRLRARLPMSMEGDVDALAAELRAAASLAALKREKDEPGTAEGDGEEEEPIPVGPLAGGPRPRRPGQPEPRPESPPEDESEPPPSRREPEPEPEPAREPRREPEPDTNEPVAPVGGGSEPSADEATDKIIADALKERLHAYHNVHDGVMDVTYQFTDPGEGADFQGRGWDKFEINKVNGMADGHLSGPVDLELGAGSRGLGVLTHLVELAGDFTIDVELWTAVSGQMSEVVFMCGKQVGVRWGSQLVMVKKGGGVKPLGPDPDRLCYKAESQVQVRMERRGDTLEVKLNGTRVAQKAFKPGELDGPFGLFAGNVRIVVTSIHIRGKVDTRKL